VKVHAAVAATALVATMLSCRDSVVPNPPLPALYDLAPGSALVGSLAFTLQLRGERFLPASHARWNGASLTTTFVTESLLTAVVPADQLAALGTAVVTVYTPGGGSSGTLGFPIVMGAPAITSIAPASAIMGSGSFTLTVSGAAFTAVSVVRWNGAALPTTWVSETLVTADVNGSFLSSVGTAAITVYTPPPGGGVSTAAAFTVLPARTWSVTQAAIGGRGWDATIAPNGVAYVTRVEKDSVLRIDVAGDAVLGSFRTGVWPYEITFNAAGSLAWATHAVDNTVALINTATHAVTASWTMPSQPIRVRVNAAGTKLYVTHTNGVVAIVHPGTGAQVSPPVNVGGVLNGIAFTPDGAALWVTNTSGGVAEIITATDLPGRSVVMGGRPQDVLVSPNGSTLYVANEAGWIGVYALSNMARLDSIAVPGAFGLAFSPDGSELWVSRNAAGQVTVFAATTRRFVGTLLLASPRHIAFAADGTALIASEDGRVFFVRAVP